MMNCVLKTRNCVLKTRNRVFKKRHFVLKSMIFAAVSMADGFRRQCGLREGALPDGITKGTFSATVVTAEKGPFSATVVTSPRLPARVRLPAAGTGRLPRTERSAA